MFDFFKRLFNRVTPIAKDEPVQIDITDSKIIINKNKLSIPCSIERIAAVLGSPRAQRYETKPEDKNFLQKMHNGAPVTDRVNYMWDGLGIKCYTLDGKTVNTFGIELNKGVLEYPNVPKCLFCGTVTIKGQPWLSAIKSGSDEMVLQKLRVGNFNICAEYVDIDQDMNLRTENDYTGIEIYI